MAHEHDGLRRRPEQARSEQRMALILDTAAMLLDEASVSQLNVSTIAKRAEMSGPGIYRYFDDIDAIIRQLATRNLERLVTGTRNAVADDVVEWPDAVSRAVAVCVDLYRHEPGFRRLALGDAVDRHLISPIVTNKTLLARQVAEIFKVRFDVWYRPDLLKHVEVLVEMAMALVDKAFESDPDGDEFFLAECARVLFDYFDAYLARTLPAGPTVPWPDDWGLS